MFTNQHEWIQLCNVKLSFHHSSEILLENIPSYPLSKSSNSNTTHGNYSEIVNKGVV